MKTFIIAVTAFLFASLLNGIAGSSDLTPDAIKWLDWNSKNIGAVTSIYANGGTVTVTPAGSGGFGADKGEITFTSNNKDPIAEHQFGNAIWGAGGSDALFNPSALSGKAGIEMLVNVDPSSTSDKICVKLKSNVTGEVYSQTVPVTRGSIQCVQFPLSKFKGTKNPDAVLTDFGILDGTIQITDGWNGFPKPAQAIWIVKCSYLYTYQL